MTRLAKTTATLQVRAEIDGQYRPVEVPAYATTLCGVDVVVHRQALRDGETGPGWVVSEPRSGASIRFSPERTRETALRAAETFLSNMDDPVAKVEAAVRHLERRTR